MEYKEGSQIQGTDGKSHEVKKCRACGKLFYFQNNPESKVGYDRLNVDRLNVDNTPHVDPRASGNVALVEAVKENTVQLKRIADSLAKFEPSWLEKVLKR